MDTLDAIRYLFEYCDYPTSEAFEMIRQVASVDRDDWMICELNELITDAR